ncbi:MAG: cyclic nucleotide-binding domain-containing protein [Anaerolineales bacterium]|jgi:CRP-like cAMP-binding protein|uniref:cyclic nucleotide-binding domain-containing protein n=1 Tax=Candidatus Villigracilis affinis TaxID=3140682 RepID=UPI002A19B6D4|nr:cyclic nucleotide-binding domain-containing protein [Anaerolineales bacterium]MBL0344942.1 cyclic nucleotide-binding domain-containing protein [Anaerolineales bacterium]
MLDILPNIPLFENLDPAQIALLKPLFEQFIRPANTTIFEQGEPASYLYLLIKGEVIIRFKPYDTPPITLTRLRAGDVFGWSAVLGSTHYTSSLVSETEIETIRIRGSHLLALVRDHPETGKIIMDRLANVVSSRWKNARTQVQALLNSTNQDKRE